MRITEDDLTKNMLAATANMINCVNGAAGKEIAGVKSLVIDLETEA